LRSSDHEGKILSSYSITDVAAASRYSTFNDDDDGDDDVAAVAVAAADDDDTMIL